MKGICNKIYKAFHGVSRDDPEPATPASNRRSTKNNPPKSLDAHAPKHPNSAGFRSNKDGFAARNSQGAEFAAHDEPARVKKGEMRRSGSELNNRFSAYISNVKKKIRTVSNVGSGAERELKTEKTEEKEKKIHVDDRANDYIKRAKMKIRTTSSSLGFGKSTTFKKTGNELTKDD